MSMIGTQMTSSRLPLRVNRSAALELHAVSIGHAWTPWSWSSDRFARWTHGLGQQWHGKGDPARHLLFEFEFKRHWLGRASWEVGPWESIWGKHFCLWCDELNVTFINFDKRPCWWGWVHNVLGTFNQWPFSFCGATSKQSVLDMLSDWTVFHIFSVSQTNKMHDKAHKNRKHS